MATYLRSRKVIIHKQLLWPVDITDGPMVCTVEKVILSCLCSGKSYHFFACTVKKGYHFLLMSNGMEKVIFPSILDLV